VTAVGDGRLERTELKQGDPVKAGQVVVRLIDSQLQRELDLADLAVQEQKAKLGNLKRRHLEELERVRGYATVEMKNIRQTKLEIEALKEQLDLAERQEKRLISLKGLGYTTALKLEEASRNVITLRKDLEVRQVELKARIELSEQNVGKRMYSGNETIGSADLVGKLTEIEGDIRFAEHEVRIAEERRQVAQRHREGLVVRSPFDGVVQALPRVDEANVRRGDVIAVIEQRKSRQVTAYLNQDEVLRVGLGDEATVFVPALGETLPAKVVQIDRTSGFVEEQKRAQNPGYRWRGPMDRTAKVTLDFADARKVANSDRYRSGLPVVVIFPQHSTNSILAALGRRTGEAQ
jgi:multidrug resistance efflux pump